MINSHCADAYDVKFLVGPVRRAVQGNKAFLAFTSTVFKKMFFSDFRSKNVVEVPDVDADAFELMINSVSGRDVIIDADNVAQVYYAAEKYDFSFLRRVCKTFVVNSIDSTKALKLLNTYHQYNDSEINEKCLAFILDDPLYFFGKSEFLEAPADVVRSIFKPIHINCSSQDIEKALKNWMSKNGIVVRYNKDEKNWVDAVENQLKITRAELEMKYMRRGVFMKPNFHKVEQSRFGNTHPFHSLFTPGDTLFSLQGFGLIIGETPQETFQVEISHGKNLQHQRCLNITVKNERPNDEVAIQNVFFEKICISQGNFRVKISLTHPMSQSCFQFEGEDRFIAYWLVSSTHPTGPQ
jgi:BTB/POZ domain